MRREKRQLDWKKRFERNLLRKKQKHRKNANVNPSRCFELVSSNVMDTPAAATPKSGSCGRRFFSASK